jgi:hypothetical protein
MDYAAYGITPIKPIKPKTPVQIKPVKKKQIKPELYYKVGPNQYAPIGWLRYGIINKLGGAERRAMLFTNKQHLVPDVPVRDLPSDITGILGVLQAASAAVHDRGKYVSIEYKILHRLVNCDENGATKLLESLSELDHAISPFRWCMSALVSPEAALFLLRHGNLMGAFFTF